MLLLLICCLLSLALSVSGRAIPSELQLNWQSKNGRIGAIIHYEMATVAKHQGCSRKNWLVSNDAKLFGKEIQSLDLESWFISMEEMGVDYAVLVVKHNCGFTTFPTNVKLPDGSPYDYSIQYSSVPTNTNIVSEFLSLCEKYHIMPGFYYSISQNIYLNVVDNKVQDDQPLLQGQVNVTMDQYYDIVLAQLGELWSYKPDGLFEIWFDGGFPLEILDRLVPLKEKLQPNAIVFNGFPKFNSTLIRWTGTETGIAPLENWSSGSCNRGMESANNGGDFNSDQWCPAEVDSTMQTGDNWFYIENLAVHSLSELIESYEKTLGRNSNWLLDFAPHPNSSIVHSHADMYKQIGTYIRSCYQQNVIAKFNFNHKQTSETFLLNSMKSVNRIRLCESLVNGHQISKYSVEVMDANSKQWAVAANGTSVGTCRIEVIDSQIVSGLRVTLDNPATDLTVELFNC